MTVSEQIICNVRSTKIFDFLKSKKIVLRDDDQGLDLHFLLGKMIQDGRISQNDVNHCIYHELMFGSRRLMRFYELKSARKLKREECWKNLLELYDCPSLNFNRILETTLHDNEKIKVAAINTIAENNKIRMIDILFLYNMKLKQKEGRPSYCYSYLPVSFDFTNKTLLLKVWNREEGTENNTPIDQINAVFGSLVRTLSLETNPLTNDPQKVLYRMSKSLFDNFFRELPNINEIEAKKENMDEIVTSLLSNITLKNVKSIGGNIVMNPEVINVSDEMYKLLQQVALYDYLKDHSLNTLLKNTDIYISRIKFNDKDNLSASLTNETGADIKCIFDTKTFMCVRNSLELAESIVSIVVSFVKEKGLLTVKYDASDRHFISIHILQSRYYNEDDYRKIWELYKKYEFEDDTTTGTLCAENNAEAM